ncbi:MAG: hypothetical protein JAZ03_07825 [Candidatus Thiodiazotropha taylori]|nr:hypothetical protein [Candidatus Thiodiazotropha taylori]MCW4333832.1 hypothetical protein [Candidatus Thiodiazotropha endolucinida]
MDNMSAAERHAVDQRNPVWRQLPGETVMAKIIWSREACEAIHAEAHRQGPVTWPSAEIRQGESFSLSTWGSDLTIIEVDVDEALAGSTEWAPRTLSERTGLSEGQTEVTAIRGAIATEDRGGELDGLEVESDEGEQDNGEDEPEK